MDNKVHDPGEMTGAERYAEMITILASAVLRCRFDEYNQSNSHENERSLTGLPLASKHSCPNRKPAKVRAEKGAKE